MQKKLLYSRNKKNDYSGGICLNMILKNESKNIPRLFDNLKNFINYFIICDTGSTDNTIDVIKNEADKLNIDGEIYSEPFKNFGYNRTYSYNLTKETNANFKYVLFLDADMTLVNHDKINIANLDKDIYHLQQKNSCIEYFNLRMVKKGTNIVVKCPTHEYYDIIGNYSVEYYKEFWINDIGDGGCKEDKFERDIRLLTKGIEEEPNNMRYYFYLAQSYKDVGKLDLSIENYKKRIDFGGWVEEVWFSYFMVSKCYLEKKDEANSIYYCLKGYEYYPKRSECIHMLAKYFCDIKKYNLCKIFLDLGEKIELPDDKLFVSRKVYEYEFIFVRSIMSYYINDHRGGLESCNKLLLKHNISDSIKGLTNSNLFFYLDKLKINFEKIKINYPKNVDSNSWNCMNPSILKINDNNYLLNLRIVNYKIINNCYYHKKDNSNFSQNNPVTTRNIILNLNNNLEVVNESEIYFDDKKYSHIPTNIVGYEDMRIFNHNNELYFLSTCRNFTSTNKIVFGNIDKQNTSAKLKVLYGIDDNNCQKNWVPIINDDIVESSTSVDRNTNVIHIVYSYNPFIILNFDLEEFNKNDNLNQNVTIYKKYNISEKLDLRGSTQFIRFKMNNVEIDNKKIDIDGYISIVHEVIFMDRRIYLHRFMILDKIYKPLYLSYPFYLFDKEIQYTCGMCTNNNVFIVSSGFKDEEAYLVKIPFTYLNKNIFSLSTYI
jgi:hypothetical protein